MNFIFFTIIEFVRQSDKMCLVFYCYSCTKFEYEFKLSMIKNCMGKRRGHSHESYWYFESKTSCKYHQESFYVTTLSASVECFCMPFECNTCFLLAKQ